MTTIDEKTRLDLRQGFEELLGTRLADAAMEAMPPLDYDNFATKQDIANLGIELRGELHTEVAKLRTDLAVNLRATVLTQLTTTMGIIGFVVGFA